MPPVGDAAAVAPHRVFAALGDPSRLAVVELLLRHGPATATELASRLTITRQAVAKHLGVLADAALVRPSRSGRGVRYALQPAQLEAASAWLERTGRAWDARLDALEQLVEGSAELP